MDHEKWMYSAQHRVWYMPCSWSGSSQHHVWVYTPGRSLCFQSRFIVPSFYQTHFFSCTFTSRTHFPPSMFPPSPFHVLFLLWNAVGINRQAQLQFAQGLSQADLPNQTWLSVLALKAFASNCRHLLPQSLSSGFSLFLNMPVSALLWVLCNNHLPTQNHSCLLTTFTMETLPPP